MKKPLHSAVLHTGALQTEVFPLRNLENRAAFPEGHLYPQMLLHTVASEKPLHIDAWTQRSFCAQKAFTETGFYTVKLTNRCLYKQKLLHRETFTNISLLHREAFARRRL